MQLQLSAAPHVQRPEGAALALAPRDAALLTWLALEGPTPRNRLAQLLWPESDADAARNTLRQRLFQLKKQLGADLLSGTATLALARGVAHDLEDADTVLGDASEPIGAEFDAWLAQQRARRRDRVRQSLVELCEMAEQAGDWADALSHAGELLALEPLSEAAHRRLIRLHYLAGDRAAALLAFDRCEKTLKDEIGVRPDAETLALLQTIERGAVSSTRLARVPPAVLRPPRLVGRARELNQLAAQADRGSHVSLVGEAGMGKSRLMAEFAVATQAAGVVSARPGDAEQPYAVFARLVRLLIAQQRHVPDALRSELARFVPELGEAAVTRFEASAFDHVGEQLLAAQPAHEPLLIDDLHFADVASIELLASAALSLQVPPMVFGMRPDDGAAVLERLQATLGQTQRYEQITLLPLDVHALHELVDSLGIAEVQGEALAAPLLRHTGGNPQFVLETLRALLLDGKAAVFERGVLPLPSGVGALIERRLKRLSPAALKLARVGAIAAGEFSAPLAAQVLGCDLLDLADAWTELEAAQVLAHDAFAHDLVFEAVRRGVPAAIARPLHAGVAAALEQHQGAAGSIARHWIAAGDLERAVGPIECAARAALATSRMDEAADWFAALARAHEQRGDHDAQMQAAVERFDAMYSKASSDELDAIVDELAALARTDAHRADVAEARARLALNRWDLDAAQDAARTAVELAQRAQAPAIECDARVVLAQVLLRKRRTDEAAAVLAGIRDWVEREAELEQRYLYEQCVAWLSVEQERYGQAMLQWEQTAVTARAHGSMTNVATAMSYQVLCLGNLGNFRKAVELAERQRDLMLEYRLFGDPFPMLYPNLAYVCLNNGRYADVLRAVELGEAVPSVDIGALALRRGQAYALMGQPARARPLIEHALERAPNLTLKHAPLLWLIRLLNGLKPEPAISAQIGELLLELDTAGAAFAKAAPRIRNILLRAEMTEGEARLAAAQDALRLLAGSEMHGLRMTAHARHAQALLELDRAPAALEAVDSMLTLAAAYEPELMLPSEFGLIAHRVLQHSAPARAASALRDALDWLHKTAADHVPAEFRDSFMHRNPDNLALLAQAARA